MRSVQFALPALILAGCTTGLIDGGGGGGGGTVVGRDAGIVVVADANTPADAPEVPIGEPPADCQEALRFYGVEFTVGPNNQGIENPVTAKVPIAGITYRYVENADPRSTLYGDCKLVRSLAVAAPLLKARGIVEVADIGIYNYRCIGGGTPPCPNGISQHAYATAIDIAGVKNGAGEYFSVNDDWVIDPNSEPTCSAATEPGKDAFLHEMICALKAAGVWKIVLTPNYNAAHRNHFHVDLSPNSDTINREVEPAPAPTSEHTADHPTH